MATGFLGSRLLRFVARHCRETLTARGRYLLSAMILFALLGIDTKRVLVYWLFAMAAGIFVAAVCLGLRRSKVRLDCRFPERTTALRPVALHARISNESSSTPDLCLLFREPPGGGVQFTPNPLWLDVGEKAMAHAVVEVRVTRRGLHIIPGPILGCSDPLGLMILRPLELPPSSLLVYPRFYHMEEFSVPMARRYQPGGIPLSSSLGDTVEFAGTREYRPGDPVKHIHWRSWARHGSPVVKEHVEEYFCRIAIILDTFLPPRPTPAQKASFEAAISVVASIADYFGRSEYIVDILAAGPHIYEVNAGRSLAYLENILDVLACIEPCHEPPFATIAPNLFEKLSQITSVVAVLQDWDAPRENFLKQVSGLGTAVRAVIVHDGPTTNPWIHANDFFDDVNAISPSDVEHLLEAGETYA